MAGPNGCHMASTGLYPSGCQVINPFVQMDTHNSGATKWCIARGCSLQGGVAESKRVAIVGSPPMTAGWPWANLGSSFDDNGGIYHRFHPSTGRSIQNSLPG
eukprot:CAMPEP_0174308528 /NCGR_PEP_ID=MMETSP0810-20121108/1819_1 /TAXON_ID=73025 ORGANISM="Eutreptiella gymnastica-like, Strain CCMP1594" /NCGR_SAMPLE_ID=MMETSP0810 /ASSEMBLY_ACC=CAM_ASM_000659 /LENGTH=101 /DNA_ID=CAMNT_0015415889 /DNA_START=342 /DNA_END=647 /DNA_ORIENTATION=+